MVAKQANSGKKKRNHVNDRAKFHLNKEDGGDNTKTHIVMQRHDAIRIIRSET